MKGESRSRDSPNGARALVLLIVLRLDGSHHVFSLKNTLIGIWECSYTQFFFDSFRLLLQQLESHLRIPKTHWHPGSGIFC